MKKISQTTHENTIRLFNAVVVENTTDANTSLLKKYGIVTNFEPTSDQEAAIQAQYKPITLRTLFGRQERDTASLYALLLKQFMHYVEVYGLDSPGLFNLEVNEGTVVTLRFIRGVTVDQLSDMVRKLLYANAPISDVEMVKSIIRDFDVSFDINQVANNELRVALFDETTDVLTDGDDVVRYMVYKATNNSLLIKSQEVIAAVSNYKFSAKFIENHAVPLAKVFNRHKRLIIAAKNKANRSAINRVTRLSKTLHVPIRESLGKNFVALAIAGKADATALDKVSLRDKFKMLNLLEYKKLGNDTDAFIIRNGKIHLESGRRFDNVGRINQIRDMILASLNKDLASLRDRVILLDPSVDYGLPISRKQTIGNLPFGTAVTVNDRISSGIYWHNNGGASDLDLSTIDSDGIRTGWASLNGYSKTAKVTFSGDVTDARDGAMEFMTSREINYGLFVNIFRGNTNSEFELVVGDDSKDRWITNTKIREKSKLTGRGSIIGFVKNNQFIVYQGLLNNDRWSSNDKSRAVVARGASEFWTVGKLLTALAIQFDTKKKDDVKYDFDLSYASFSFDRLEELFNSGSTL